MNREEIERVLLKGRTEDQARAISSSATRLLVVAGAGSGKTEVMARRIAWWTAVDSVRKDSVVAFTFGEAAAEEMKFRIRRSVGNVTPEGKDPTLSGMYVGTIHGFCVKTLRDLLPDRYHNYEVIDDAGRIALINRGAAFFRFLGLEGFRVALSSECGRSVGQFETIARFLKAYDLLNEFGQLRITLPGEGPPTGFGDDEEEHWCREAVLQTDLGSGPLRETFGTSAARYYAYLHCRRFLDFSTSQNELLQLLRGDDELVERLREKHTHVVVDEIQDINVVQYEIIRSIIGEDGVLMGVGDHRQAIYGWRGSSVEIMSELHDEIAGLGEAGEIVRLRENFRSTPRIVTVANQWADTIGSVGGLGHPSMNHGLERREDLDPSHVAIGRFESREDEATWIAGQADDLVDSEEGTGAVHDEAGGERGITYGDMAVLVRSSTDARTYAEALRQRDIPAVVHAGPDLFSQPEVLLMTGLLAGAAGLDRFYGSVDRYGTLPNRIQTVLGCDPEPEAVIEAAAGHLRDDGFPLEEDATDHLVQVAHLLNRRLVEGEPATEGTASEVRTVPLRRFVEKAGDVPRVFPQEIFHWLIAEVGLPSWNISEAGREQTAAFHLGQLSSLVRELESPGWTNVRDFQSQVKTLAQWVAENARTEETPLLAEPDAITVTTIHQAKGLEFPVIFLADVKNLRFPSSRARTVQQNLNPLPFDTDLVDPDDLTDNESYDAERRLMYVALTRAERYLFVTASGSRRSRFFSTLQEIIHGVGGLPFEGPGFEVEEIRLHESRRSRDEELVTSFSDLRYFLECPQDFYLRKVLRFAPGIHRAIGYGQGIHNLLRSVHSSPRHWAELPQDPEELRHALEEAAESGLFYLRYTTGDPARAMRSKALTLLGRYIEEYVDELEELDFEPERDFETIIEEESLLVAGAIDLVRLEDPPRVTILDFKSGEAESDLPVSLNPELMRLQIKIYGLAARQELEYDPELGLVRYLAEEDPDKKELEVSLDEEALVEARTVVAEAARRIRSRAFHSGPTEYAHEGDATERCERCDFLEICGLEPAREARLEREGEEAA